MPCIVEKEPQPMRSVLVSVVSGLNNLITIWLVDKTSDQNFDWNDKNGIFKFVVLSTFLNIFVFFCCTKLPVKNQMGPINITKFFFAIA